MRILSPLSFSEAGNKTHRRTCNLICLYMAFIWERDLDNYKHDRSEITSPNKVLSTTRSTIFIFH